jgi:branched-chain amino acid transport system permease protein
MNWSRMRLVESARTFIILSTVFVVVAVIIETVLGRSDSRIATDFMLVTSMVIAIQVYVGNSGLVSFGHVAFFAIAAYVAGLAALSPERLASIAPDVPRWLADMEASLPVAVGLAVIAVIVFAAFTGVPFARMQASVVSAATLALLVFVHSVVNLWSGMTHGPLGLVSVPDLVNTWVVLVTCLIITAAALLYRASPWGLRLQAVREDEVAAAALGIPVARMRFAGWMVSAVLMALGGSVWALNAMAFSPTQFYFTDTFAMLSMLVIGGLGSVTGAVLGAAIVTVLSEVLRTLERGVVIGGFEIPELPGIVQMATAVLILLILIWRPGGLLGNTEAGAFRLSTILGKGRRR